MSQAVRLYIDRHGDLWLFGQGGSWVLEREAFERGWLRGPMERNEAEREFGPLFEVPAIPDGATEVTCKTCEAWGQRNCDLHRDEPGLGPGVSS